MKFTPKDIEAAFREGYTEGYRNGGDDACAFEWGSGSKHKNVMKKDEDEAWEYSEVKKGDSNENTT